MNVDNTFTIFFLVTCTSLNLPNGMVSYTTSMKNGGYLINTVAPSRVILVIINMVQTQELVKHLETGMN